MSPSSVALEAPSPTWVMGTPGSRHFDNLDELTGPLGNRFVATPCFCIKFSRGKEQTQERRSFASDLIILEEVQSLLTQKNAQSPGTFSSKSRLQAFSARLPMFVFHLR